MKCLIRSEGELDMVKLDWSGVKREDVIKAIEIFLNDNPEYPAPRSTFLIYVGKKLPAKHIRGMAYKVAYNQEISKADYAGGIETVRFFERLGFEMFHAGKNAENTAHTPENKEKVTPQVAKKTEEPVAEIPLVVEPVEEICKQAEKINADSESDKIKIPSKGVIEQKNALQLILNRMFDGDIVCEKTYSWLKTPETLDILYQRLYDALSGYRGNTDFAKKNVVLRCDFVCEGQKLIIEYDERQHFSEARRASLEAYRDIPLNYDREQWMRACRDIQAKDGQPVNRDEVRAYYDSTRDIEAAKHGYKLVRIMHGQIDFEKDGAAEKLRSLLETADNEYTVNLKVAMYLQSDQWKNQQEFDKTLEIVSQSNADILVFPEFCWVPFAGDIRKSDLMVEKDVNQIFDQCLALSKQIKRAVVVSSSDKYGTIFSVFANSAADENETETSIYIKHTMTSYSAFEVKNYDKLAPVLFSPIDFKGYRIGLTICYDCNHALFSRMYGMQDVDLIINSTGGNVVYDKWFKYNQSRAIENICFTLVTMGGDGKKEKPNSYVYGFNPNGKLLIPELLNGVSDQSNVPGGIYLYDLSKDDNGEVEDSSICQFATENKYQDFSVPVGNVESLITKATEIEENLYVLKHKEYNIVIVVANNEDIFSAEQFLPKMYSKKLSGYNNRRYILVSKYPELTRQEYRNLLSIVLKVRAMENFCAVILESDHANNCYQTGKSKTAQVVKAVDGQYGLDLSRMTGPEAIWKNKGIDFKASWRKNFVWLANKCKQIHDTGEWGE